MLIAEETHKPQIDAEPLTLWSEDVAVLKDSAYVQVPEVHCHVHEVLCILSIYCNSCKLIVVQIVEHIWVRQSRIICWKSHLCIVTESAYSSKLPCHLSGYNTQWQCITHACIRGGTIRRDCGVQAEPAAAAEGGGGGEAAHPGAGERARGGGSREPSGGCHTEAAAARPQGCPGRCGPGLRQQRPVCGVAAPPRLCRFCLCRCCLPCCCPARPVHCAGCDHRPETACTVTARQRRAAAIQDISALRSSG